MRKADALRLKPGDHITFGNHKFTKHCTRYWQAEVIHVTPAGGIKVKVTDQKPWLGPEEHAHQRGNEVRWVPYTHVIC